MKKPVETPPSVSRTSGTAYAQFQSSQPPSSLTSGSNLSRSPYYL